MRDIASKTDNIGDVLTAGDFNAQQLEQENIVTSSGQTLDAAGGPDTDLSMLAKAVAVYGSGAFIYADSGSTNTITLSRIGTLAAVPSYFDGMTVVFKANSSNTGATTINVTSLGSKDLKSNDGSALAPGSILYGNYYRAVYNSSSDRFELVGAEFICIIDSTATDQGATTSEGLRSVKDWSNTIGTSKKATFLYLHLGVSNETNYDFDTSLDLSSYSNIIHHFHNGATLTRNTGDEIFKLPSPSSIIAAKEQKLTATDMLGFDKPGVFYPSWINCAGDGDGIGGGTDDSTYFQYALDLIREYGVILDLMGRIYRIDSLMELIRDTASGPERYSIVGNGAILDFSSTSQTGGQLLKVGADSQANAHDTGWVKLVDFDIKGPESSSTGLEASTPDTSLQGLSLEYCLNPRIENVNVTKCYIGVITNFMFPGHIKNCNFFQNYIPAYLDNTSTLCLWENCGFYEAHYGIVIRPSTVSNQVSNQTFINPRFEAVLNAVVIDQRSGSGIGANSIKFVSPYFEGITYDKFRIGLQWTFANPGTRNSDADRDIYGIHILDGLWENTGYDSNTAPLVFGTTGDIYGSTFRVPCEKDDIVNYPDNGKNTLTCNNDVYLGGSSKAVFEPIGSGAVVFNGSSSDPITASYSSGMCSATVTKNSTGNYTITFTGTFNSSDTYTVDVGFNADCTWYISSSSASAVTIQILNRGTGSAQDPTEVRVKVMGTT